MNHSKSRWAIAFAVAGLLCAPFALAQSYPSKPVRVIVQFPPGGTPDIYGRIMANELSKLWGQSVVVENRAGASGAIGTDVVVKSAPDGYTLLFAADAAITVMPNLVKTVPYDPVKDLTPIVNVVQGPFTLLLHPSVPAKNLSELIALIRSQPGKYAYASSGSGSQQHLTVELVRTMAGGLDVLHVPYKGFGQALADVYAGQPQLIVSGVTASIDIVKSGKLRPMGVTGPKRVQAMPDVPAIAETLPGFDIRAWYGFMGPVGMPREVVRKINADARTVVNRPDFQERLVRDGIEPAVNTPEEFAAQIKRDLNAWGKIVKDSGAKVE
jgi:tripartite-type tricarboxylate transporter receptor subunit TctC